jgi:hypothetical protein
VKKWALEMIRPIEGNYSQYLANSCLPPSGKATADIHPQSPNPPEIDGVTGKESPASGSKIGKKVGKECQTCKRRKYQDVSNDPSVSFKAPTSLSPGAEGYAVAGHESQHVANEKGKALRNGREVVSQTVQINTAVCPECGRMYVSGGKTTTVTRQNPDDQATKGRNLDLKV